MGRNLEKCECGSDLFYTCKCVEQHSHHCAQCGKKIYIDWSRSTMYET